MDSDADLDALRAQASRAEARLDAVTKAVVELYHDLSNPMSALSGNAELLSILGAENPIDADMRDTIADLNAAVQKLRATMERLRALRQALRTGEDL